jgi:5-methylcytosine-specific restriction endonuclease McrA
MTYQSKSTDSFNTRLRFYLFEKVLEYKNADFEPSLEEFIQFDLRNKEDLILKYTAEYYHKKRKDKVDGVVIDDIYEFILKAENTLEPSLENWRASYYDNVFPDLLSVNQYEELVNSTVCHYCETPIQKIRNLIESGRIYKKNERGWNLEIDRKDPNQEYYYKNLVMACYWCNNAKTDEFNAKEFKPIGEAIKAVFEKRLKEFRG